MTDVIGKFSSESRSFPPPAEFRNQARIQSREAYQALYQESLESPETFWRRELAGLSFRKGWQRVLNWEPPQARWFEGAELNITESCLDRHLNTSRKNKAAIIWESEPGEVRTLSYAELHEQVVKFSAGLKSLGVNVGDRVTIYMGMVPEVAIAMLACARIGAIHSVVFGGFAAEALRDRINDCSAKLVITQDGALRRGQIVPLKETVDRALEQTPSVEKVVVFRRLEGSLQIEMRAERDLEWSNVIEAASAHGSLGGGEQNQAEPEAFPADHPLFILYTSGSTGKPKGVLHTTGGYLAGTYLSAKYVFDLNDEDVYWCTADVGWITGHSYVVYGPLANGATVLIYEGAPNQPDWGRFWQIIDKHQVSILYTAPTAIRAFIRAGNEWLEPAKLDSLRLLGSVGEPINPEAWLWYHQQVGKERCPIVDTWWQTETGVILLTTLPGVHETKPGSCGLPLFGVEPAIVTHDNQPVPQNRAGLLVMKRPWPGMLGTIWGDEARYAQYWNEVPGVYFSGDGAHQADDNYFTVIGRMDDVLNVSGHRIGTAEVESALVAHPAVAEAAAVGAPDELTGQALVVFVVLKPGFEAGPPLAAELKAQIDSEIGKFARPKEVRFSEALPKTRSGKIMRRFLKDIVAGRNAQGDMSTLEDLNVIAKLQQQSEE